MSKPLLKICFAGKEIVSLSFAVRWVKEFEGLMVNIESRYLRQ